MWLWLGGSDVCCGGRSEARKDEQVSFVSWEMVARSTAREVVLPWAQG